MKERFLPIGSVVLLKNANKPIMVTGFCIVPTGTEITKDGEKEAELKVYDYCGCRYPEGTMDTNLFHAFNHDQIEEILFTGYETDSSKEFIKALNDNYDDIVKSINNLKDSDK